ncbi:MAG: hypothetical protein HY860_05885 [Chlamydiales bacterium]|nr:hypothetical protein [Chlamydiales bacterium]
MTNTLLLVKITFSLSICTAMGLFKKKFSFLTIFLLVTSICYCKVSAVNDHYLSSNDYANQSRITITHNTQDLCQLQKDLYYSRSSLGAMFSALHQTLLKDPYGLCDQILQTVSIISGLGSRLYNDFFILDCSFSFFRLPILSSQAHPPTTI